MYAYKPFSGVTKKESNKYLMIYILQAMYIFIVNVWKNLFFKGNLLWFFDSTMFKVQACTELYCDWIKNEKGRRYIRLRILWPGHCDFYRMPCLHDQWKKCCHWLTSKTIFNNNLPVTRRFGRSSEPPEDDHWNQGILETKTQQLILKSFRIENY